MPIQIPSSSTSNKGIPPASLPQLPGLFPTTQSHSLPNYFLSQANLAYFVTNTNQHLTQPLHIITALNHPSLQYPNTLYSTLTHVSSNLVNETSVSLQNKRSDNDERQQIQSMDTNKQCEEQLPFKKRRYTGQPTSIHSPMDTNHHDDETSNESIKK